MLYSRTITCPICRKKTELPSGGIKRLPDNFLVANLTEILSRQKTASKLPLCEICNSSAQITYNAAVAKCLDCAKLFCSNCVELHKRTKVTKEHSMIDVEVEKDIGCKVHENEIVRFYCEPCEVCICVLCTFQEHKGHEVSSFMDGMQKYKNSLDSLVMACRERIAELHDRLELMQTCEAVLRKGEERIRDTAIESISVIRKREKQMTEDLHGVYGEDTLTYLKEKTSIQEVHDNLVSTCNLTDIILKDKGVELLLLKRELQEKLQLLLERMVVPQPKNIIRDVQFVPGSLVFGHLDIDGQGLKENAEVGIVCSSTAGCDVMLQTDSMTDTREGFTTMDKMQQGFDSDIFTQTDKVVHSEQGTTTSILTNTSYTMTHSPRVCESETMTDAVSVMKRKVQTDPIVNLNKETSTARITTTTQQTNTQTPITCERSTLTIQKLLRNQLTDTTDLIMLADKIIGTTVYAVNMSTITDIIETNNKAIETYKPFQADKMTLTKRISHANKNTCTPTVHMLDMGADVIRFEGVNKGVNTRTIVTTDMAVGDHTASTVNQGTDTIWQGRPKLHTVGTMVDIRLSVDTATSPCRLGMVDKFVSTRTLEFATISTCTDKIRTASKGLMCKIRPRMSDKGVRVKPSQRVCDTQTDITMQSMENLLVRKAHYDKETNEVPTKPMDVERTIVAVTSVSTSTTMVGMQTTAASPIRWNVEDVAVNTIHRPTPVRQVATETDNRPLVDTASDACIPASVDQGINTDSAEHNILTTDADIQTDLSLFLHQINPLPITSYQDTGTTMASTVYVEEFGTEMPPITMIDKKMSTSPLITADRSVTTEMPCSVDATTGTNIVELVDRSVATIRIPLIERATGMLKRNFVNMETNTRVFDVTNKETNTIHVFLEDRGMTTPRAMMFSKDTNTITADVRTICTNTFIPTVDKATYMLQPVLISTGSGTPTVDTLDKKISTIPVETRICSSMTPIVTKTDRHTEMDVPYTSTKGTCTVHSQTKDQALDAYHGDLVSTGTFMPRIIKLNTSTGMEVPTYKTLGTCTAGVETVDRYTGMEVVITTETGMVAKPEGVDVGILKRPHTLSRSTSTKRIKTADRETRIVMPVPWTSDQASITEHGQLVEKAIGTESVELVTRETETYSPQFADSETSMPHLLFKNRESSPMSIHMIERESSPVKFPTNNQKVSAIVDMDEKYTETIPVETMCHATSTQMFVVDRESSPVHVKWGDDASTSMIQVVMKDSNTSTDVVETGNISTSTLNVVLVERESTPVHFETHDKEVWAQTEMVNAEVETHVDTQERGMGTIRVVHQTRGTEMPHITHLEKETCTPQIHLMHKNVSTENIMTADKHTSMSIDVAAVYKDLITPKAVIHGSTVSRGTCTNSIMHETKETSTPRILMVEKATSPMKVIKLDKAVSVSKGELIEPKDKFHKPGGVKKGLCPENEEEETFTPKLASIREDSKEWSSSDDDAYTGIGHKSIGVGTTSDDGPTLVHTDYLWSSCPNTKPGTKTQSTFTANGSNSPSSIRCQVEAGTSTPPVETEDKAVSTDSFAVDGSLADCISKLKNVRQRLETQTASTQMGPSQGPIYSKTSMMESQGMRLPSVSDGTPSLGASLSHGIAQTTVTTVHSRSKSVGDEDIVKQTKIVPLPFLSPPPTRRNTSSSSTNTTNSMDSNDEMVIALLRSPKARKQRLDINQLLKSVSMPDRSKPLPPFALPKPQITQSQIYPSKDKEEMKQVNAREKKRNRTRSRSKGKESDGELKDSTPSLEGTRVRTLSEGSEEPTSSPERLREHLQQLAPLPETGPRPTRAERIKERRSRAEKHRDRLERQAFMDEARGLPPGHLITSIRSRGRDLTPPAYKPGSGPLQPGMTSPRIGRRIRRQGTGKVPTDTSTSITEDIETTDVDYVAGASTDTRRRGTKTADDDVAPRTERKNLFSKISSV